MADGRRHKTPKSETSDLLFTAQQWRQHQSIDLCPLSTDSHRTNRGESSCICICDGMHRRKPELRVSRFFIIGTKPVWASSHRKTLPCLLDNEQTCSLLRGKFCLRLARIFTTQTFLKRQFWAPLVLSQDAEMWETQEALSPNASLHLSHDYNRKHFIGPFSPAAAKASLFFPPQWSISKHFHLFTIQSHVNLTFMVTSDPRDPLPFSLNLSQLSTVFTLVTSPFLSKVSLALAFLKSRGFPLLLCLSLSFY